MVTPYSRLAYSAEYDLMDQAIESERGVQRLFPDYKRGRGPAFNARVRLQKARDLDRLQSTKEFSPGDPKYGNTVYAQLIIREPFFDDEKKAWIVRLEKNSIEEMIIEEIPGLRDVPEPKPEKPADLPMVMRRL